jgi:hypothetical protein
MLNKKNKSETRCLVLSNPSKNEYSLQIGTKSTELLVLKYSDLFECNLVTFPDFCGKPRGSYFYVSM